MGLFGSSLDILAMLLNSGFHRLFRSFMGFGGLLEESVLLVGNRFLSDGFLDMLNRFF